MAAITGPSGGAVHGLYTMYWRPYVQWPAGSKSGMAHRPSPRTREALAAYPPETMLKFVTCASKVTAWTSRFVWEIQRVESIVSFAGRCQSLLMILSQYLLHGVRSSASLHVDVLGLVLCTLVGGANADEERDMALCKLSLAYAADAFDFAARILQTEALVLEQMMFEAARPPHLDVVHWEQVRAVWRAQHAALIPTLALMRAFMVQSSVLWMGLEYIVADETVDFSKHEEECDLWRTHGARTFLESGLERLVGWARRAHTKIAEDLDDFVAMAAAQREAKKRARTAATAAAAAAADGQAGAEAGA